MKFQRKGVGTAALAGAVIVVAIVVGVIGYFVGQSGSSSTSTTVMVTTSTASVGGSGSVVLVTATSTATRAPGAPIVTTTTILSTVGSNTTITKSSVQTVYSLCPGCVNDADGDGV